MSSTFNVPLADQLVRARQKINSGWANDSVSDYDQLYAALTCKVYGDFARSWIWAKNHTTAISEGAAPTGFQFNVSPRAPLFSRPFSRNALSSGILCFPLLAGQSSALSVLTKKKYTLEHFADPRLEIDNKMLTYLGDVNTFGSSDESAINYAGICWSFERSEMKFYCVVQAHNEHLSREAYSLIETNEPDSLECVRDYADALIAERDAIAKRSAPRRGIRELREMAESADDQIDQSRKSVSQTPYMTWYDMFFKNDRMRSIAAEQDRHRARIACISMQAVGVGPVLNKGTEADSITYILEHADTINASFNCVEHTDRKNMHSDVVYLSNLTSAWDSTSAGSLLRASIDEGFVLFRGRLAAPRFYGSGTANDRKFIGVPIATGPIRHVPLSRVTTADGNVVSNDEDDNIPPGILWTERHRPHCLFDAGNWRERDTMWRDWEVGCGLAAEPITLKPVRLRVAEPLNLVDSGTDRPSIYKITQ